MRKTVVHHARRSTPANRLLASLPHADLARGDEVARACRSASWADTARAPPTARALYFPETCIVSLLGVLANGDTSEVSLTGREGCVGLGLVLGGRQHDPAGDRAECGHRVALEDGALRRELRRGGAVERMLLHYVQAVWSQTAQSALCNRHHTLEQQMCRWFLASLDRVNGNTLRMTQS